jgi:hypothetical protein
MRCLCDQHYMLSAAGSGSGSEDGSASSERSKSIPTGEGAPCQCVQQDGMRLISVLAAMLDPRP